MTQVLIKALIFMLSVNFGFAQNTVVLRHKTKLNKQKQIKTSKGYQITTADSIYHTSFRLTTDSSVLIVFQVKTGRDTSFIRAIINDAKDSMLVFYPIFEKDTLEILFSEITHIRTQFFNPNGTLGFLSWFAVGSILAVPLLPVAAFDKSNPDGLQDWIGIQGMMLGVSVPSILLLQLKQNFDLQTDWTLHQQSIKN